MGECRGAWPIALSRYWWYITFIIRQAWSGTLQAFPELGVLLGEILELGAVDAKHATLSRY